MLLHHRLLYRCIHSMKMIEHEDDLKHIQEHRDHQAMGRYVKNVAIIN